MSQDNPETENGAGSPANDPLNRAVRRIQMFKDQNLNYQDGSAMDEFLKRQPQPALTEEEAYKKAANFFLNKKSISKREISKQSSSIKFLPMLRCILLGGLPEQQPSESVPPPPRRRLNGNRTSKPAKRHHSELSVRELANLIDDRPMYPWSESMVDRVKRRSRFTAASSNVENATRQSPILFTFQTPMTGGHFDLDDRIRELALHSSRRPLGSNETNDENSGGISMHFEKNER